MLHQEAAMHLEKIESEIFIAFATLLCSSVRFSKVCRHFCTSCELKLSEEDICSAITKKITICANYPAGK